MFQATGSKCMQGKSKAQGSIWRCSLGAMLESYGCVQRMKGWSLWPEGSCVKALMLGYAGVCCLCGDSQFLKGIFLF